jgi:hypothetical protein
MLQAGQRLVRRKTVNDFLGTDVLALECIIARKPPHACYSRTEDSLANIDHMPTIPTVSSSANGTRGD